MELSPEFIAKIEETITRYPVSKRSASLPLLHLFQEEYGFVSPEAVEWIAAKLDLAPINVYELVTFYPMFRQKPAGRYHFRICRTLSCAMAGSYALRDKIAALTGIDLHQANGQASGHANGNAAHGHHDPVTVSADGKFSVEFVECLASCGSAPVCMVNDEFHDHVTEQKASEFIAACR